MSSPIDPKDGKPAADRLNNKAEEATYRAESVGTEHVDKTRKVQTAPQSGSTEVTQEPKKGGWLKWALLALLALLLLGLLFWFLNRDGGDDDAAAPATTTSATATATTSPAESSATSETATEGVAAGAQADPQSALADAQAFVDSPVPFSYQGLYDHLISAEGGEYTPEAAQFAVDNVNADWNHEAAEAAQGYAANFDMTPEAILDELGAADGGKFTPEQAQAGVATLS